MKKLAIILFSAIFLFSCEEVVQIDVPSGDPKLVIDATFEVFFDAIPVTANTVVKLRLSADYFENEIPIVTNAIVSLENLSNNTTINFDDTDLDGDYTPTTSFIPQDDVAYELSVVYNNETFKAIATKTKTPTFTNVEQGNTTLFSGKETELKVDFTDDGSVENYYIFDFTKNRYIAIEDRFFNGSDYNFSFFYREDDIELPTDVTIKMSGVTQDYYTYFRVLVNQSGQNGGGPFQTVPASLLGNIVNTTDIKNFPLGYFHISETDTYNIALIDKTN
jgi:hypothetical protein